MTNNDTGLYEKRNMTEHPSRHHMRSFCQLFRELRSLAAMGFLVISLSGTLKGELPDMEGNAPGLPGYCTKIVLEENIEISLYKPTMFRFRVSALEGEKFPAQYEIPYPIGKTGKWEPVVFKAWEDDRYHYIETSTIRIIVSKDDYSWTVWKKGAARRIYPSKGKIYGMFRDGYTVFDNASAFGERNNNSPYSHWFYNPSTGRYVDTYLHEDLIHDLYFIYGPGYPELFSQLNELLGPEPLLPLKGYGFFQTQHLGCAGDQVQLMKLARDLREHEIPCDNLIIDFEWGDGCPGEEEQYWGQLDWAPAYEVPLSHEQMLSKLDSMHFNVMLIHHSAPNFPHREINTLRRIREWTSEVYSEEYWWQRIIEELDDGADGSWQDTRQNDITDGVIWSGIQDYFRAGQRVLFMGCRKMMELNPYELKRDNTIPANNLIGTRRYPFRWTGDIDNTYREFKWQVNAITNSHGSMKGVSYITADCFAKNWKLQARWNQFIDFNPVSRSHTFKPWQQIMDFSELARIMDFREEGIKDIQDERQMTMNVFRTLTDEKKALLPTAENSIRKHRKLRYRLLPYIYSTAYVNYLTGFPICRPMLLAFPHDLHCDRDQWPFQYMFGENFLVAPVYADLNSMEIYLPEGHDWIDYWDKTVYKGGQVIDYNTSDVEKLPLFVRSGAIIPMRKDQNWIEKGETWDPVILDIYPFRASEFTLYEDDKFTTAYQQGEFSKTAIECHDDSSKIVISINKAAGEYKGKPGHRAWILQINQSGGCPSRVVDGKMTLTRYLEPDALEGVTSGWLYDPEQERVYVRVVGTTSAGKTVQIIKTIAR